MGDLIKVKYEKFLQIQTKWVMRPKHQWKNKLIQPKTKNIAVACAIAEHSAPGSVPPARVSMIGNKTTIEWYGRHAAAISTQDESLTDTKRHG
ncbi:hypothetical protein [Desulfurivibrio alkaliphilus]|uniref:Uncharacterized protein n=1 Tax=Desulfurivibrio alkaliphilus (strain DSM 19089 / UNIQEM U267 / AHT2) TaxID=589865 RepID=D6Z587_DESAT|nr:hypothetical protein [Desulfurivibrio alkaliphilus]ADH84744.1 hypothetical protein DaAHT2_0028 [Desulfurivibrio alkaliphilus AHT 2]